MPSHFLHVKTPSGCSIQNPFVFSLFKNCKHFAVLKLGMSFLTAKMNDSRSCVSPLNLLGTLLGIALISTLYDVLVEVVSFSFVLESCEVALSAADVTEELGVDSCGVALSAGNVAEELDVDSCGVALSAGDVAEDLGRRY